jgi:hypothetical protein
MMYYFFYLIELIVVKLTHDLNMQKGGNKTSNYINLL